MQKLTKKQIGGINKIIKSKAAKQFHTDGCIEKMGIEDKNYYGATNGYYAVFMAEDCEDCGLLILGKDIDKQYPSLSSAVSKETSKMEDIDSAFINKTLCGLKNKTLLYNKDSKIYFSVIKENKNKNCRLGYNARYIENIINVIGNEDLKVSIAVKSRLLKIENKNTGSFGVLCPIRMYDDKEMEKAFKCMDTECAA